MTRSWLVRAARSAHRRLVVALALFLAAAVTARAETSGTLTLTNDYMFRGVSQTRGNPALQLGGTFTAKSGGYGSIWASNVDFGPGSNADVEIDLVAGWSGERGEDWSLDVSLAHYLYPGQSSFDCTDVIARVTRRDRLWLAGALSNHALASDDWGVHAEIGRRWEIGRAWRLELAGAHYALPALATNGYSHARLGLIRPWKQFETRLAGHWADSKARDVFGDAADPRVEVAVTWSF